MSLSGVLSVAVLAGLVAGLGWGGWLLVEDIQRVGFAPSPETPGAIETPPNIAIPGLSLQAFADTNVGRDAERDAALAALYAPRDLSAPDIALRDGPIAAIDPDSYGLYADLEAPTEEAGPRFGPTRALAAATPVEAAPESDVSPTVATLAPTRRRARSSPSRPARRRARRPSPTRPPGSASS